MQEELTNQLKQNRIKPTPVRILVLEKLLQQKTAGSIADLEGQLEHRDRVTLYRTLKTFEENGLVYHIDDGTGTTKYALCSSACTTEMHKNTHVHFHCTSCGSTICLPDTQIPLVNFPDHYQASHYELLIRGTCASCD